MIICRFNTEKKFYGVKMFIIIRDHRFSFLEQAFHLLSLYSALGTIDTKCQE